MSKLKHNPKHRVKCDLRKTLPAFLLVTIWPLLAHIVTVRTYLEDLVWFPDLPVRDDYFLVIRAEACLILTAWMAAVLIIEYAQKRQPIAWKKLTKGSRLAILLSGLWFCLALLSSAIGKYRRYSFTGVVDSYETVPVLLAYLLIFLYGIWFFRRSDGKRKLEIAILAGASLQTLIGLSQLAGHDFWASSIGRSLLLFGSGRAADSLRFEAVSQVHHNVYMSFYNPMFAAVYILIVLPFTLDLVIEEGKKLRTFGNVRPHLPLFLWSVLTSTLLLACLHGTGAKAARLVCLIAFPLYLLIKSGLSGKKKGVAILILAGALILLSVLGMKLGGSGRRNLFTGIRERISGQERTDHLVDLSLDSNSALFSFEKQKIRAVVVPENGSFQLFVVDDGTDQPMHMRMTKKGWLVPDDPAWKLEKGSLAFRASPGEADGTADLFVWYGEKAVFHFAVDEKGILTFINPAGKEDTIVQAQEVLTGLDDSALTGRAYLWKRTLALLPHLLLIGSGQESFPFIFPQNDYVGRANAGSTVFSQTITRPHSLYLQVLTGAGGIGLLLFLGAAGILFASGSFGRKGFQPANLALLSFLLLGLVYDSLVVVTPVMCLLAAGNVCYMDSLTIDGSAQFHNIYEQSEILSHNAFHELPIDYAYAEQPEHLVTIEERDRLPDDRRTELIDGVLYDMAGASLAHQTIMQGIFAGLKNCIDRYKLSCKAFVSPADIVLEVSPATVVEPDVFVICDPKKIKDGKYYGAPKIVVEVMSPSSRKMDSIIKLNKYMSSGVEEYWMVDPEKETVTVHDFRYYLKPNPQGGRGQVAVHTYPFSDRIPVLSSDGLCEIDFSRIKKELEWFVS